MYKKAILLFLLCSLSVAAGGTGWKKMTTNRLTIRYREPLEDDAIRFARMVQGIDSTNSLGILPRRLPVTILGRTNVSNGFTGLAPFQIQTFAHPPQGCFQGTADWMDILAVHEYRHAMQFSSARGGVSTALNILMGDMGRAGAVFACQPQWFLEGDAVNTETALTMGGRGRQPDFIDKYRALRLSGRRYSYQKAQFGSYRDYVPNYYNLGYYLVSYGRRHFGREIWQNTLRDAQKQVVCKAFSHSLESKTGMSTDELYDATFTEFDSIWTYRDSRLTRRMDEFPTQTVLSWPKGDEYIHLSNPAFLDGQPLCLRTDKSQPVYLADMTGKPVFRGLGYGFSGDFDSQDGKIVWSELRSHVRWPDVDYSVIMAWDSENGRRKLTKRSRYFSPAFSADGVKICAVEHDPMGSGYAIVLLDSETGDVLKKLSNPDNVQIIQPCFSPDGREIASVVQKDGRHALALWNIEDETRHMLIPWDNLTLQNPVHAGDRIFYQASYTENYEIYAIEIASGVIRQITATRFGASDPYLHADSLYFSTYTDLGGEIRSMPVFDGMEITIPDDSPMPFYRDVAAQENLLSDDPPEIEYEVSNWHRFPGDYPRLHSWGFIVVPDAIMAEVMASNLMGDFNVMASAVYGLESEVSYGKVIAENSQFWPSVDIALLASDEKPDSGETTINDDEIELGISLPLNISGSRNAALLRPRIAWFESHLNDPVQSYSVGLTFARAGRTAHRDFYYRYAQYLSAFGRFEYGGESGCVQVSTKLYFPGLFQQHYLYLMADYAEHFDGPYRFGIMMPRARGFTLDDPEKALNISGNYEYPILYPDVALGNFWYIKRLRAGLFFDHSIYTLDNVEDDFSSTGFSVNLDGVFFRMLSVDLGFYVAFPLELRKPVFGLLLQM